VETLARLHGPQITGGGRDGSMILRDDEELCPLKDAHYRLT